MKLFKRKKRLTVKGVISKQEIIDLEIRLRNSEKYLEQSIIDGLCGIDIETFKGYVSDANTKLELATLNKQTLIELGYYYK